MTLGEFLKIRREEKNYTIEALSKKTGISGGQISRLENNEQKPRFETIIDLARALDMDLNELAVKTGTSPLAIPMKNGKVVGRYDSAVRFEEEPPPPLEQIIKETVKETLESEIAMKHFRKHFARYKDTLVQDIVDLHTMDDEIRKKKGEDLPPGAMRMVTSNVTFPLVKNIRAGELGTELEMEDEPISAPGSWEGKGTFCIKVKGNSMKDEGIPDGMICLIRKQPTVESGNIALVYKYNSDAVNGILKKVKYLPDGKPLLFNGSNENFEIGEDFEIIGKVIAWYKMP